MGDTKFQIKEIVKSIFNDIDKAIEETKKSYPVPIEESDFLKRYLKIKENYL